MSSHDQDDEPTPEPEQRLTPEEHAEARQQPEPGDFIVQPPDDEDDD